MLVALSGGVDSSTCAALLLQAGWKVSALTLRLWREDDPQQNQNDTIILRRARAVADALKIPLEIVDVRAVFYQRVIEPFLQDYASGSTPNPCVLCNRFMKWAILMEAAASLGAGMVASGHYACIKQDEQGTYELHKGADPQKDQSYFLCMLNQEILAHTLFPLGGYHKTQIRSLALGFGLPSATHSDSQDLCFLPESDYRSFLTRHAPQAVHPGDIQTRQGRWLGQHQGLAFYTIGQRKGLPAWKEALYVLEKDVAANTLVVGPAEELGSQVLFAKKVNWIGAKKPQDKFQAEVKIRYKALPVKAEISPLEGERVQVAFEHPLRDITPGQIVAFYEDQKLLGGGIIEYR